MEAPFATFRFRENEGPLRMEFDFSDMMDAQARLEDYHIHAHIKASIDDDEPAYDANTVDGTFVIVDADMKLAEISIPLEDALEIFSCEGKWHGDLLLIEKEAPNGRLAPDGYFEIEITSAYTRDVA